MVTHRCSDTSTPGSRYPQFDKNEIPLGKCRLNSALPTEKGNLQMTRQSTAERIRIVSKVMQT
jgi:hypothetical protein